MRSIPKNAQGHVGCLAWFTCLLGFVSSLAKAKPPTFQGWLFLLLRSHRHSIGVGVVAHGSSGSLDCLAVPYVYCSSCGNHGSDSLTAIDIQRSSLIVTWLYYGLLLGWLAWKGGWLKSIGLVEPGNSG